MQNAPLWLALAVALFAAVIGPVMTYLGVRMTLRSSREQAEKDATRRLEAQREAALADQKLQVYSDVMLFMSRDRSVKQRRLGTPEGLEAFKLDSEEYRKLLVQVQFLGSENVHQAMLNLWGQIIWVDSYQVHPERESFAPEDIEKARKGIQEMESALRLAIRDDLGIPQRIDREAVEAIIEKGSPLGPEINSKS